MSQSTTAPSAVCGNSGCVSLLRQEDGSVTFTSTVEDNTASITYTADEFDTFRSDVKDGKWDFI